MKNVVPLRSRHQYKRPVDVGRALRQGGHMFWDHDPLVQQLIELIHDSGMTSGEIVRAAYDASGGVVNIHYQTVERWMDGRTRRPQNYYLMWVGFALGYRYDRQWLKIEDE